MSLRTVTELAIHFESFRNVDLFHQGLYHLKTRIYREGEHRQLAIPYSYIACPVQVEQPKGKSSRTDHHHLIPAHIIEEQCTFSTRSFLIRYCEEEVELDDIGQFRIEFEADQDAGRQQEPLILEVDLMFADLTQHGGADRFGEQPDVDSTEFKSVSQQVYRLHGIEDGIHEFCPVVFDEFHFCLAGIVIHSAVVDLRLRVRPVDPVLLRPKASRGKPGLPAGAEENEQPPQHPVITRDAPGPQRVCLSLAEVLMIDRRPRGNSSAAKEARLLQNAEGLYLSHVGTLIASHRRQAEWFDMLCSKCLTAAQREVFKESLERPELRLPEGWPENQPATSSRARAAGSAPAANGHGKLVQALQARLGAQITERAIAALFAYDLGQVSCQILELWHMALNVLSLTCRESASFHRVTWESRTIGLWRASVLTEVMPDELAEPRDKCIGDAHNLAADNLRRTMPAPWSGNFSVEDVALVPASWERPVLFEQRYRTKSSSDQPKGISQALENDTQLPSAPKDYRGVHLFVLVHGFQGNSFDMRLMKNNIALLHPDAVFLCSNSNEDNTEGDFNEMGIRLAQEVVNYICDWCPGTALGRLSFIAHSIGGLIVRSALPLLHEYSSKMFTLLTFSTPHVGYFLRNLTLFHVGLRVLQSWRQSQCLSQLSMADAATPQETFLYRLSSTRGLEFFQHICLVSCPSDQYSPFDSARVEIGGMLDKHVHKEAYMEMVRNIWEPVKPERVIRFDVNFHIAEKNLDTFIGRAAHIQFLECQPIMKQIIHNYSYLFR